MWEIEYSEEVNLYFLDNYLYTFDLLIRIEELKFYENAISPEGYELAETIPEAYIWNGLEHEVFYAKLPAQTADSRRETTGRRITRSR